MADVFISHANQDSQTALRLADALRLAGYSSWVYERDGLPGVSYLLQTGRAIDECRAVLLLISSTSLSSHQMTKEVVRAHESDKPFVPVLIDVTHAEFKTRQPEWRSAVGAALSISLQDWGLDVVAARIASGLEGLGFAPAAPEVTSAATPAGASVPAKLSHETIGAPPSRHAPDTTTIAAEPTPPAAAVVDAPPPRSSARKTEKPSKPSVRTRSKAAAAAVPTHAAPDPTICALEGNWSDVTAMALSPDGKTLAVGDGTSLDYRLRFWQVADGKLRRGVKGQTDKVMSLAFSPDGKTVAAASWLDNSVRLWAVDDAAPRRALRAHTGTVRSVVFSTNGNSLATAADDRTVRLWRYYDGAAIRTFEGHTSGVCSVAFSPDGELVASGSDDRSVRLWSRSTGPVRTCGIHRGLVTSVAFSPDGKTLASAGATVRLWNVSNGALLAELTGHSKSVTCLAFSRDGSLLASGSDDQTVRVWRIPDGTALYELEARKGHVHCVAFLSNGTLAAGAGDDTVLTWRLDLDPSRTGSSAR